MTYPLVMRQTAHNAPVALHVVKALGLGGTEKVMQLLVQHLDRERYSPIVFSHVDGPRGPLLRQSSIHTHIGRDLFAVITQVRPAIVHLHRAGWAEPELLRPVKRAREALARSGHTFKLVETNVFGRHDASPQASQLDATLFVSHFCARRYESQHGIPTLPPRYQVLYNPVDTDLYAKLCPPRSAEEFAAPVLGRLSRPDPGKWSPLALNIIEPLARLFPEFRYRIVGGGEEAREFVRSRGLAPFVDFLPELTTDQELAEFFNSISILAHANDTGESFGLAIAEAMASGLPVITHPCPGLRDNAQLELVEHGVTGLVAKDVQEYVQAAASLFRAPARCANLGQAGQAKAHTHYRVQTLARRLADIYDELVRTTDLNPS